MDGRFLSRRSVFSLAAGAVVAAAGSLVLGRSRSGPLASHHSAVRQRSEPRFASSTAQYRSSGGVLELDLTAQETAVAIPGAASRLFTYNGLLPGPLLEVEPGDAVRLRLHNRLTAPTNLHYHGLHIPPDGIADNVFLSVAPGTSQAYNFLIPDDHPAGTFYYHPHRHGSVADQVFAGLGGVLIVRGALDRIPEVAAASEQVLFLKDLPDADGRAAWGQGMGRHQMLGREGPVLTVNGTVKPEFTVSAGGLLRLRIVNGSNARFWRLALEGHSLHLIATDGGALEAPVELRELLLVPGERAEVLVQASTAGGRFRLLNLPYNRGGMGMGHGMGRMGGWGHRGRAPGRGWGVESSATQTIATITTTGSMPTLPLPSRLLPVKPLPMPQRRRTFAMNHGMQPRMGMVFLINGKAFDGRRNDTQVQLGETEEWELVNEGVMDHPFHVHVNPVQVISRNGRQEAYRAWRDVVLLRPGERVLVRIRFADFPGRTVYHCHILDHEELGMMGTLQINA